MGACPQAAYGGRLPSRVLRSCAAVPRTFRPERSAGSASGHVRRLARTGCGPRVETCRLQPTRHRRRADDLHGGDGARRRRGDGIRSLGRRRHSAGTVVSLPPDGLRAVPVSTVATMARLRRAARAESLGRAAQAGWYLFALVVLVPWRPDPPPLSNLGDIRIDVSYMLALPEIERQQLQFGPHIDFTYGPLGMFHASY